TEEEQKSFKLPAGFEIQLFASEPEITKPLNMAFDDRGRLWITNTVEYPYPAPPDRKGKDSIRILEDTDGDGRADKITTFVDGLNIPMGLYPYKNGVIAFSIPYIWFFEDTDGDDKADRRTKLFGPFGFDRDAHGLNNSFRRGFDGWIYANHGFNNETTVKGTDGHTVKMQSGNTYRFRPDGSRIEQFTWGQVNPFGSTFDELGNLFTADCHSKPIYQLLRGGYYPSFGKPHDGLGFVSPMMDHLHGSTAISGLAQYSGSNFPAEYRGDMFSGNVMTSRVNRDSMIYHGSTILAKEEPDFVVTTDPWFRPVDLQVGPDDALYIADFYNRIIGHYEVPLDHPGRDRTSGRIWRVTYTGNDKNTKPPRRLPNLTKRSVSELISALGDQNQTLRTLAANRIVDHYGKKISVRGGVDNSKPASGGRQPPDDSKRVIGNMRKALIDSNDPHVQTQLLWILHRLGALNDDILFFLANDKDRMVRIHAMKVLAETSKWSDETAAMVQSRLHDPDAFVRRAAADALGRHPDRDSLQLLLAALKKVPTQDNHLRHTIRMAVRDQLHHSENFSRFMKNRSSTKDDREIASVCLALETEQAGSFLLDFIQNNSISRKEMTDYLKHVSKFVPPQKTDALARFAQQRFPDDLEFQTTLITSIHTGLKQRGEPASRTLRQWGTELSQKMVDSLDDEPSAWFNIPIPGKRFTDNPWVFQTRPAADGKADNRLLSSHPRGEHLTGILRSQTFTIPNTFSFYLSGHDGFPNKPILRLNFVRLRQAQTHELLAEVSPPRNDTAQKIEWDLKQHAGTRGYLELVDGNQTGAFAWLAAGRFDPSVVTVPKYAPRNVSERLQAAAEIVATLRLNHLQSRFSKYLSSETTEPSVRAALARALVANEPDSLPAALIPALGDPSVSDNLRLRISRAYVKRDPQSLRLLLGEAIRTTPRSLQVVLAENLSGDNSGAELLLDLIEEGHASTRLLQNPTIKARLLALKIPKAEERIKQLTSQLPSLNAEIQKLIETRKREFSNRTTSIQTGVKVFEKNCAACHQIDGKGPLIGPQLDGIGNRGLERLVEDLLDPNRNVDVAFRMTTIVATSGKVYTGLFRREEGAVLILVDNKGKEFSVSKSDVDERIKSNISLMPANVVEIISRDDFHHLLAYLLSKRANPKLPPKANSPEK
ncbi:MAG: HEAT repeat domain-containing protein, partial [Planctomycetes bacterium]|nr:HEAT repeat domain-containing protein [Planctomycetota bacterium]